MRVKLEYTLPLAQMPLAVALLLWTARWQRDMMRTQDMPGTPASFSLLVAINAPVALPRAFWSRYLHGWWDDISFVAIIGLFWYWVALNVSFVEPKAEVSDVSKHAPATSRRRGGNRCRYVLGFRLLA
jgi:hypothetical protein